jgi:hypothetical protein
VTLQKTYSIALIALGTILEFIYYLQRFMGDGIHIILSCVIALSLNVFLGAAVLQRKRLIGKILVAVVILYSIINTNAGQELSLSVKQEALVVEQSKEANKQDEITLLTQRLQEISAENAQILRERAQNLIGSGETSRRQADLKVEREAKENDLKKLREEATTHKKTVVAKDAATDETNTYKFYEKLLGIPQNILRFFFHIILSVFIAFMAPLGLLSLTDKVGIQRKPPSGFIGWWAAANAAYSERTKKQMPGGMLRIHAKNAGFGEQEVEEMEALMPVIDISESADQLAARMKHLLKKKQREER